MISYERFPNFYEKLIYFKAKNISNNIESYSSRNMSSEKKEIHWSDFVICLENLTKTIFHVQY